MRYQLLSISACAQHSIFCIVPRCKRHWTGRLRFSNVRSSLPRVFACRHFHACLYLHLQLHTGTLLLSHVGLPATTWHACLHVNYCSKCNRSFWATCNFLSRHITYSFSAA